MILSRRTKQEFNSTGTVTELRVAPVKTPWSNNRRPQKCKCPVATRKSKNTILGDWNCSSCHLKSYTTKPTTRSHRLETTPIFCHRQGTSTHRVQQLSTNRRPHATDIRTGTLGNQLVLHTQLSPAQDPVPAVTNDHTVILNQESRSSAPYGSAV